MMGDYDVVLNEMNEKVWFVCWVCCLVWWLIEMKVGGVVICVVW